MLFHGSNLKDLSSRDISHQTQFDKHFNVVELRFLFVLFDLNTKKENKLLLC